MAAAALSMRPRILTDAERITAIADRVNRLMLRHTDPEAFYVEKSDISGELRRLARQMGGR